MRRRRSGAGITIMWVGIVMLILGGLFAGGTAWLTKSGSSNLGASLSTQLQWITPYDQSKMDSMKNGNDPEMETFLVGASGIVTFRGDTTDYNTYNEIAVDINADRYLECFKYKSFYSSYYESNPLTLTKTPQGYSVNKYSTTSVIINAGNHRIYEQSNTCSIPLVLAHTEPYASNGQEVYSSEIIINKDWVYLGVNGNVVLQTADNPTYASTVSVCNEVCGGSIYDNTHYIQKPFVAISGMGTCDIAEISPLGNGGTVNKQDCVKVGQPLSDVCLIPGKMEVNGQYGFKVTCKSPTPNGKFGNKVTLYSSFTSLLAAKPRTVIPPENHLRYFTCPINNNYQLVTESFSAGTTISKYSMRYPVNYYCARFPVIKTSSADFEGTQDALLYETLVKGSAYQIPSGETHTFFYVVNNNGQLPTICDPNGAIDPTTGRCVVSPGIIHICSQGQFDPALGMCAVQPESTYICEQGGYYDKAQAKCIYHPPVQAICTKGTYNVDKDVCEFTPQLETVCIKGELNTATGKCDYYPGVNNVCSLGTYNPTTNKCEVEATKQYVCQNGNYNPTTNRCEVYPQQMILCPGTFAYNQNTGYCEKIAETQIQCTGGAVYDSSSGKCLLTPPEQLVCGRGVYNEALKVCVYTPDFTTYCPQGDYDKVLDACVIQPSLDYLCLRGTLTIDPITGLRKCTIYPEITVYCNEIGGVYDVDSNKCMISPDPQASCSQGTLETINGQLVCTVRPDTEVICGDPKAQYVKELGVCQSVANTEYLCTEGQLVKHEDGTYGCALESTPEYSCVGGFQYDAEKNVCLGSPEDNRFSELVSAIQSKGYVFSGIIALIGLILFILGLIM